MARGQDTRNHQNRRPPQKGKMYRFAPSRENTINDERHVKADLGQRVKVTDVPGLQTPYPDYVHVEDPTTREYLGAVHKSSLQEED